MARRLFAAPALKKYVVAENLPGNDVQSDDELLDYARQYGSTVFHATCTCKMGPDAMAVVDDHLRVHGLQGLRVIDASVMPTVTSTNTNAPTIMIGRDAAEAGGLGLGEKKNVQLHHRTAFQAAGADRRGVSRRRRPRLRMKGDSPIDAPSLVG
jgi:hypothetical protein